VFYSLLKRDWRKYNKNTLDILYDFFKINRDNFYRDNLKKWYPKTPSLFGTFIRYKRLQQEIDIHKLAKKIKMDQRALARLESGDSLPTFD
jgi:ribosome-binding protein aMBF1 (putative translation factor)